MTSNEDEIGSSVRLNFSLSKMDNEQSHDEGGRLTAQVWTVAKMLPYQLIQRLS